MGNEQSVSEEPTQTEKIPETHENGSVNGLSAGVPAPASEISVTVEPTVEKNGGPLLLSLAVEPNGIGQVTDGGDGEHEGEHRGEQEEEHVDAAVVNEAIEKVVEEVKKSKEEKVSRFGKLFKMKPHVKNVPKEESPGESPAGASTPEEEPQQESSSSGDDTTSLRTLAGERTGSKLVMMEPEEEEEEEEALSQSVVATEEPAENQRIPAEEELFMNDEYQNIFFSGGMEMDEGVPETEDDIVASLTSTDQEEVSVPLMSADSRGGPGLTRPGRSECIPVITRAEAGSAAAKADPVNTPEAAIEAFFQLLGDFAFPEPAVDAEILLEDEAVVAATSEATSEKLKLPTAERRRGEGPGTVGGEAADAWVEEPEGAEAQSFVEGHFERDFETIEDTTSDDARRHVTSEQEAPDLSRDSKDTTHLIPEAQPPPEPDSASVEPSPEEEGAPETDDGNTQPEQIQEEDDPENNPVMNFFKTLVTPTKTAKKSSAAPDAAKDQSENENQPAETATVAQVSEPPAAPKGMSVPPPPPPEPPKMETKGETSAKPAKTTPKEEPVKEPEASKGKSAKEAFGKFFRSKKDKELPQPEAVVEVQPVVEVQETPVVEAEAVVEIQPTVEEEPQPVAEEEKVDPSKTGTLEAAPKPEPPPPAQEKKPASKSGFMSLFKSKAADPKKASPAPPAAAEPAPAVKTKEEPKPAAKPSETPADNKAAVTAAQAGEDAPSGPKKLEKRNSIQLFFKIRSQKRNSTDAGIQTEPLAGSAAAEKSK